LAFVLGLIFLTVMLLPSVPFRAATASACIVGIVVSGTRTIAFALPPIYLVAHLMVKRGIVGSTRKLAIVLAALGLGGAGGWWMADDAARAAALFTVASAASGDFLNDESVSVRLGNFQLGETTLRVAPWSGVVTRDFIDAPEIGGVDSEYLLTFHRYGLIGLGALLSLTVGVMGRGWLMNRRGHDWGAVVAAVGALTLAYGLTQGAWINTRLGPLVAAVVAMAGRPKDSTHDPIADDPGPGGG
jgi:hypothetical protein